LQEPARQIAVSTFEGSGVKDGLACFFHHHVIHYKIAKQMSLPELYSSGNRIQSIFVLQQKG
jgi:hypothetical protein